MVDINDRDNDAPLESFYNGLYSIGQAAVPINMIVLGASLHNTYQKTKKEKADWESGSSIVSKRMSDGGSRGFTSCLAFGVVLGKMVIMPVLGVGCVILLSLVYKIPGDIDASFYLTLLIVTATPTANNVMTMAVQAGKDGIMAKLLFWQYFLAPVVLTVSVGGFVALASTY